MAITDGLPNPPEAAFPFYYVQNQAMQRAFEHLWANSPGPDTVGLQDSFLHGLARVVERFAGNPWVLGYEPITIPRAAASRSTTTPPASPRARASPP
jgi:endoglycosylceramidase